MNLRTITSSHARSPRHAFRRPPIAGRRPALYLAVAAAGALMVNVVGTDEPAAHADPQLQSVSVAQELGISAADRSASAASAEQLAPLEQLAASRSTRDAERTAAARAQTAADKAELAARAAAKAAAEKAARVAAQKAARVAAQKAAAAAAAAAAKKAAAARPSGSFQDYALNKIGSGQFSCLENLWGKESGWNPNAQNPSSTAYGIPQLLDSTWGGTGIAKTSDGYRQIDAGLVYIQNAYGSPCAAWGHSQSTGWY
jgi:septal ring-binding cell division protein DamX